MRIPIYVNGDIPIDALQNALAPLGFQLRIDAGHRFVIDRVPAFLSVVKDEAHVVVEMKARKRR